MLERGSYGVEWTPRKKDDDPSLLGRAVLIVIALALASLTWTIIKRVRTSAEAESEANPPPAVAPALVDAPPPPPPKPLALDTPTLSEAGPKIPPKLRNLLMRLEEADKAGDVEMAVTTIETIRALPGSPAAHLDNDLARRLGLLNVRRLFELKSAQWIATVTVKRGDSASRLASEHGSTLASLVKLNGGAVDRLKIGDKIFVLNHPRFNLVVKRRSRIADLQLNGKFFKRYDLMTDEGLKDGAFEWRNAALKLKPADKAELDTLLPRTVSVLVSEM